MLFRPVWQVLWRLLEACSSRQPFRAGSTPRRAWQLQLWPGGITSVRLRYVWQMLWWLQQACSSCRQPIRGETSPWRAWQLQLWPGGITVL